MSTYFLYRHIRPDTNQPFYIGIGSKKESKSLKVEFKRAFEFDPDKRSQFWYRIFEKCNKQIDVEIIYETDSWDCAKEKEKEFIRLYGRRDLGKGHLVNMTDGGDGTLGSIPSEKTRKQISDANKGKSRGKGRKATPEARANMSKAQKGNHSALGVKRSEETKRKMSLSQKGKPKKNGKGKGWHHSDETKLKISVSNKGKQHKPHSEETKLKISKSSTGRKQTEATKQKMSKAKTGIPLSPEHIEKIRILKTGTKASPETRLKMSESGKKAWDDGVGKRKDYVVSDETKAKQSAARRGKKQSPESNAKRSKAMKGYKFPPEFGLKISLAKKGKPLNRKGYVHSEATKLKMSETRKQYWNNRKGSQLNFWL